MGVVSFELDGRPFSAINGGPMFSFTPAISLVVSCEGQDEVDYYWERLCDGGEPSRCGWLVDRFGVSWQVVPTALAGLHRRPRSGRRRPARLRPCCRWASSTSPRCSPPTTADRPSDAAAGRCYFGGSVATKSAARSTHGRSDRPCSPAEPT